MVLRASTQLVNSPKNTGRIATLWPLFLQLNITFRLEDLLHSFKRWIVWKDVILYIRSSKTLRHCKNSSWKHRGQRLTFLSALMLSILAAAEHSAWSGALWMKLSTLKETDQCGWSVNYFNLLSEVPDSNLTGIRLSWQSGLQFFLRDCV